MLRIALHLVVAVVTTVLALVLFVVALSSLASAATLPAAIVTQDRTSLRAAPRDSGREQAALWQGEMVEVRGERLDYLQVYDYKRERGGFVRRDRVRRIELTADEAPELLSVVRFLRDTPGTEALGIAFAAAYVKAAPADVLGGSAGVEALDALGTLADRLARRASSGATPTKAGADALSAHLDVAHRYGVNFVSYERDGRMQICYEGEAFRHVLAMRSSPEQRARAVIALTRQACFDRELRPLERNRLDEWRAGVLDRVEVAELPPYLRNRVLMARASVWSSLAYQRARKGETADAAAERSVAELAAVDKAQLTDDDVSVYNDAVMRVSASRWAAVTVAPRPVAKPRLVTAPGDAGETCISLVEPKRGEVLIRRCTYGIVWLNSATLNREGTALAVAVQPMDAWRELWIFCRDPSGWTVRTLPPATANPNLGYAEFAGWMPGGSKVLVAREARSDGKYRRSFEVLRLDTLAVERQASDPDTLDAFKRWQDPDWRRGTLSIR